jgi:hypothetical protein
MMLMFIIAGSMINPATRPSSLLRTVSSASASLKGTTWVSSVSARG